MGARRAVRKKTAAETGTLAVRLDDKSKRCIREAAKQGIIVLSPDEQLAFWNALNKRPKLTASQKRLAAIMRGGR
jgi:hypothetical protein